MSKLFLCGITSSGNGANLRAMIEPIRKYFDGLIWTFHFPKDEGADYLESQKGDGEIIYAHFKQRHGNSMTQFLWQGPMEAGDHFVLMDSMERVSVHFCEDTLPKLLSWMEEQNIAMVANGGKGLIYRFNDQLEFRNSPHWVGVGLDGSAINVNLEPTDFWNVRGEQRGKYHWIGHFAKYWLYPVGSNHALLGLDHFPKDKPPEQIFQERDAERIRFLREMKKRGFPRTPDGLKAMLSGPLDDELKQFLRNEKVLSDYWHYEIMGNKDVKCTHNPADALPVP